MLEVCPTQRCPWHKIRIYLQKRRHSISKQTFTFSKSGASMFSIKDKTAIVTGATKGLGYAMAKQLAMAGANIVVVSRSPEDCSRVATELTESGTRAFGCSCDISNPASIENLVQSTLEHFGRIDILVNNAGTSVTKPAEDLTVEDWDRVINTNLRGVFLLSQAVGKQMILQKGGRIINIASVLGLVGNKGTLPYTSGKGGVIQLTRGLAMEWARHNILVNAVAPGYVVTDMNRDTMEDPRVSGALLTKIPLRRFGKANEIAAAVVFLASDEASYMTGSVLTMDGGWTAQ